MAHLFSSLRFRILLLVLLAVLPALGLILYSGLEQRRQAASGAQKDVMAMVFNLSAHQERVVEGVRQMLATLAKLPAVRQQDGAACNAIFAKIVEEQKILGNISAADRQGKLYATALPQPGYPPSSAGRSHFERALQTKEFAIGEYGIGRASGKPTIHFGYPIIYNGEVIGVVSTSVILDYLNTLVANTKMPPGAMITVIDRDGTILARHPQPEQWVGKRLPEAEIIKIVVARGEGLTEAVGLDGVPNLLAFATLGVGSDDLFVYAGVPVKTVYAEATRILTRNLLTLGGVAVLALVMAWLLGQVFLVGRTHSLMNKAQRMAGGDLTVRSDLSYEDGEFGQLAKSFDEMAAALEQQQKSLRESEEKYRTLVEQVPAIIYNMALDDARTLTYVSPQVEVLLGVSPAEYLADPAIWKNQLHPDDRDRVLAKIDLKNLTNESIIEEFRVQSRSGDWRWFHAEAKPVMDSDGWPRSLRGVLIDITDRKRAEEEQLKVEKALRESEKRFRDIAENAAEWVWEVDAAGKYTFVSPVVEKLLGYKPEEILSKHFYDLFLPGEREELKKRALAAFAAKQPFREFINQNLHKDGSIVWLATSGVPILDKTENLLGYRGADINITERKQAEEALRESEEKYRLLASQIPTVLFRGYADWSIDFFDEKAEILTGYSLEDFNSRKLKWDDLILLEDLPAAKDEGLNTGQSYVREYRIRRKDGEIIWIQNLGRIFCDASGKIDHVSGVLFDITDRKQAEERLGRANRALRALSEANQAMVRATDEQAFLHDVCRVIVEVGGYPLAWIGFAQPDAAKTVSPVAYAGINGMDPWWINITWDDDVRGRGPGGMAIKTGKTQVIRNILNDLNAAPWYEDVSRRGLNSIIALPLLVDGKTIGILDILSGDLEAFDEEESNLLEDLAAEVSYGIWSLRTDAERRRAEVEVKHTLEQLHRSLNGTVLALANTLESRDPYTAGHQRRVSQLACAIAQELGLSQDQIDGMRVLGFLHDLGKIAVPAEILSRPGNVSEHELNIIKSHAQVGYDIVRDIEFPWPIAQAILQHHERLNGSGYPNGLTDPDIIQEAKILAVADVVEAMALHRPYRPALGIDATLEEITKNKGTLYNAEVVDSCVRLFREKSFTFE